VGSDGKKAEESIYGWIAFASIMDLMGELAWLGWGGIWCCLGLWKPWGLHSGGDRSEICNIQSSEGFVFPICQHWPREIICARRIKAHCLGSTLYSLLPTQQLNSDASAKRKQSILVFYFLKSREIVLCWREQFPASITIPNIRVPHYYQVGAELTGYRPVKPSQVHELDNQNHSGIVFPRLCFRDDQFPRAWLYRCTLMPTSLSPIIHRPFSTT
jgi:hypothetical protein